MEWCDSEYCGWSSQKCERIHFSYKWDDVSLRNTGALKDARHFNAKELESKIVGKVAIPSDLWPQ